MEFPDLGAHCSWSACQRLGERRGDPGVGTVHTLAGRPRAWAWTARTGQPGLRGGGGAAPGARSVAELEERAVSPVLPLTEESLVFPAVHGHPARAGLAVCAGRPGIRRWLYPGAQRLLPGDSGAGPGQAPPLPGIGAAGWGRRYATGPLGPVHTPVFPVGEARGGCGSITSRWFGTGSSRGARCDSGCYS